MSPFSTCACYLCAQLVKQRAVEAMAKQRDLVHVKIRVRGGKDERVFVVKGRNHGTWMSLNGAGPASNLEVSAVGSGEKA